MDAEKRKMIRIERHQTSPTLDMDMPTDDYDNIIILYRFYEPDRFIPFSKLIHGDRDLAA